MLASLRDSCAGSGEGWAGLGGSWACPSLWGRQGAQGILPNGSLGPCLPSFPWDGSFSPWVLFMCFEDHFCIVRSEEKIFWHGRKKIFTYPGGP